MLERPSPNHNDRRGRPIDLIVLHYTGMPSAEDALAHLTDPAAEVSTHYLIEEDGRLWRLVPDRRRAWHAGCAYWAGETDVNARSIGIELVNPGHDWGYRTFPRPQIARLCRLLRHLLARYRIPPHRVVGHSDVAPLRKKDPGELFPWWELAVQGLAVHQGPVAPLKLNRLSWEEVKGWLGKIGYGYMEEDPRAVLTAVQRRSRPRLIDGRLDGTTAILIANLANTAPETGPSTP
ncbi:MAG: N-acetylmuramoyl-L-alanine amidase [Rhodospirillales bacterium]|nr:N-acetylmuramoyl-L-alanine amidase [Rhodospirillales bacterium]